MRVIRWMQCFALAGLGACAGTNEEMREDELAMAETPEATIPSQEVQPVAGHEEKATQPAPELGKTYLMPQGQQTRETGTFKEQRGQWVQPEGVYGQRGTYGVEGKTGVKGTYGTYFRAEESFQKPESLSINREGGYIQPFGSEAQPGEPLMSERQPVAGRDAEYFLMVADENGKTIGLRDPALIKNVEEKLAAAGALIGKPDGKADKDTGSSLVKFQSQHGLTATGALDRKTGDALGVDWGMVASSLKQRQMLPSK